MAAEAGCGRAGEYPAAENAGDLTGFQPLGLIGDKVDGVFERKPLLLDEMVNGADCGGGTAVVPANNLEDAVGVTRGGDCGLAMGT